MARIEALAAKIEEAHRLRRQAMGETSSFVTALHLALSGKRSVQLSDLLVLDERREAVRAEGSYPQVGVRGFGQGLFPKDAIEGTQTTYSAFNRLYAGAVILSQVKGWEGAIAVCSADLAGRYVSPEYRTFRCISGVALHEYLAAVLVTPWFWHQLATVTRGMGGRRERTRPEQFLRMTVPMPMYHQQQKALGMLERIVALKRLQERTVSELDAMLPAVLDRAFKGEL